MKQFFYILFLVSLIFVTGKLRGQENDLPMACSGGYVKYGVKGFNGISIFSWKIYHIDSNTHDTTWISPSDIIPLSNREDSIKVNWRDTYVGGIYTFEVVERTDYGCTGEPYTQDIVLNTPTINIPFDGVPASFMGCFGTQLALDPGEYKSYFWQDKSTNRIYFTGEAGTYQVRLENNANSCTYNDIQAIINPLPVVNLGKDTVLFGNQTLLLDATNPDFVSYKWSDNSILPTYLASGQAGTQTISVTVRDFNGCENSDEIKITAADYNKLSIPAAFTPNGDGVNDKWYFPSPPKETGQEIYNYFDNIEVHVFNRWGRLVWKSSGEFVAWDGNDLSGQPLPMDSYHYIIKFKVTGKTYTYTGSVTIIR